jgi:alkylation response protein AidB-like acyl-CoA dehydrogenase
VEGEGLRQANQVFGYTRLMVAALGIGGGTAALERAVDYSKVRVQFGSPLCEKQGYTHRLLVPHAVRLEAARAYVEEVARRLEETDKDLQVEGSVAKYFATEAADRAANDAIQAFGGYGYMREYEVEKIKRDVKILTIYEGTSEIQRNIISVFRMRETVRTKAGFYGAMAEEAARLGDELMGDPLSNAVHALNLAITEMRRQKLSTLQYAMFLLADMAAWLEVALELAKKARYRRHPKRSVEFMKAASRVQTLEAMEALLMNTMKMGIESQELSMILESIGVPRLYKGLVSDMDLIARELVS